MQEILWLSLSLVIGFLIAAYLIPDVLFHPTSVDYLSYDMLQHFIGWAFFRQQPWSFPLTAIHNLAYPLGSNLLYTDSVPLLALGLKLFTNGLPTCFVWQGTLAVINLALLFYATSLFFRVLRLDNQLAIIAGLFMILSSTMLFRLSYHYSLTAQWLIVFNLALIVKSRSALRQDFAWQVLLLLIACGIHPYLAFMNLVLNYALIYKLVSLSKQKRLVRLYLALGLLIVSSLVFYLASYFFGWWSDNNSFTSSGFGFYSANLLSLINPQFGGLIGKSFMVGAGQYEGFAYLGLGIIIPLVVLILWRRQMIYTSLNKVQLFGLYFLVLCLFILALSNKLQIAQWQINLAYNDPVFGIWRASGRFIWPLFYLIMVATILWVYDSFNNKSMAKLCLCLCLIVQYLDQLGIIKYIQNIHATNKPVSTTWHADLKSKFWYNLAPQGFKHLNLVLYANASYNNSMSQMIVNKQGDLIVYKFTLLALANNLTINDMYFARGSTLLNSLVIKTNQRFLHGDLDDSTLYLVTPWVLSLRAATLNARDCRTLDGYFICATKFRKFNKIN